jgi:hypothetical protein
MAGDRRGRKAADVFEKTTIRGDQKAARRRWVSRCRDEKSYFFKVALKGMNGRHQLRIGPRTTWRPSAGVQVLLTDSVERPGTVLP